MTRPRDILPPSSTPLERVIDTTFPRGWGAMVDTMEPAAMATNASALPWVVQQWQLARIERFFPNLQAVLENGLPWLRERGTAAGVRRALSWLGYTNVTIEEDGARLHINPGREVSNADIAAMAYAVRQSIPLHVGFYRVFYRYDLRMLRWDSYPKWDSAIWDNVSGAPVDVGDGGPPVIGSQARFNMSIVEAPKLEHITTATLLHYASRVRRLDAQRWDAWRWDGAIARSVSGVQIHTNAALAEQYQPLPPISVASDAVTSLCDETRPDQLQAAQILHFATGCTPRVDDTRKWTGRWDARPWRTPNIQSHFYEITE